MSSQATVEVADYSVQGIASSPGLPTSFSTSLSFSLALLAFLPLFLWQELSSPPFGLLPVSSPFQRKKNQAILLCPILFLPRRVRESSPPCPVLAAPAFLWFFPSASYMVQLAKTDPLTLPPPLTCKSLCPNLPCCLCQSAPRHKETHGEKP